MTKRTIAVITAMTLIAPMGALAMTNAGSTPETVHQNIERSTPPTVAMPAVDVENNVTPPVENKVTLPVENKVAPAVEVEENEVPAVEVEENEAPAAEDNVMPQVEHDRSNKSGHDRAND